MQTTIYLDHNATTPMRPVAVAAMQALLQDPGNASSVHRNGKAARRVLDHAREVIMKKLNAGARDVLVFTSGATEANNMVMQGVAVERIIASSTEHPSVLEPMLARKDVEHHLLPVTRDGLVDLDALAGLLRDHQKQTLVSVMLVNNETGVIQPLSEIAIMTRKAGCMLHTDAVQALGRMPIDVQALGADFVTLSAHKAGGPQGAGCLLIRDCMALAPLLRGGNQEQNMRAGTENVAAIAGFAAAVEALDLDAYSRLSVLRDRIEASILAAAPTARIYGAGAPRVANTLMFGLEAMGGETISGEAQMIALDLAGICVSNGSACASGTVKPSHVLKAMGAGSDAALSGIRVSLGWNSTEADVDGFIAAWTAFYERIKSKCQK